MTDFAPRDPLFEERVRASFGRQSLMATLGARLASVAPGRVEIALPRGEWILQQHGFVHGGVVASIADSAAGYAALSLMPAGRGVLTAEFKLNFLAPAAQENLVAVGIVEKAGRTLSVVRADVFGLEGDRRIPIALLFGTMMSIEQREGVVD
jgi:uncharacterized protein (TIGR00369 family)